MISDSSYKQLLNNFILFYKVQNLQYHTISHSLRDDYNYTNSPLEKQRFETDSNLYGRETRSYMTPFMAEKLPTLS